MKYLLSICLLLLLLVGCHQDKPAITKGKYFFDFDEVVYYKTEATTELLYKRPHTPSENLFIQIVNGNTPQKLSDTNFLSYIDTVGYIKKVIPARKHAAIREIFSEKNCEDNSITSCTRFFRDIYIFKKKGKVTGVAKLCYECGDEFFISAKGNTSCFGATGEYEKLTEIVK